MDVVNEQRKIAGDLVTNLEALRHDRSALARLKRCAGRPLAECTATLPLFYRLLPAAARGKERLEDPCFLVASLFPLAPDTFTGDLGRSLRLFSQQRAQHADGVQRRLSVLLDCSADAMPFRLRQAITLLSGADIGVDWRQLLIDLMQWEWTNRPAQRRWARSYFGTEAVASTQAT